MTGLTKKQLALRAGGIGASEIAVLAGLSRYSSPIEIYESKVSGLPRSVGYTAELGLEIEAPIARVWAKLNDRHLALVDTLRHPTKQFAFATPDRAVYLTRAAAGDARKKKLDVRDAERLLQVKSTNWRMRHLWGDDDTDSIPDEFVCQAQWEAGVAGVSEVTFAVDFDKTALHTYRVRADAEVFEGLYEIAERFMVDHVFTKKPPDPDASAQYGEFLARAWPRHTTTALRRVHDGDEVLPLLAAYAELHTGAARVKHLLKLTRHRIVEHVKDASGLEGTFGKLYFRAGKDKHVTDWKQVSRDALDLAKLVVQVMPPGEQRTQLATQLETLVGKHTSVKPGSRTMRAHWSDDVLKQLETIHLNLTPLDRALLAPGEEESEEETQ